MSKLTIPLPKKDQERLNRLAIRYGFSLPEFASRLLRQLPDEIPTESFADYDDPKELRASLDQALKDWKSGKVTDQLT